MMMRRSTINEEDSFANKRGRVARQEELDHEAAKGRVGTHGVDGGAERKRLLEVLLKLELTLQREYRKSRGGEENLGHVIKREEMRHPRRWRLKFRCGQ